MSRENLDINQLLKLAYEALQVKNFGKAKDLFEKIISINKNIPEVYNNLGIIYMNDNNFEKAKECFNNSINLNPKFSIAFCNLGMAYYKTGNFKLSEINYNKSISLDKKNVVAHFNLGNLYKDMNDLINAEKYYNFALDLKPDMLQVYKNLFFIFYKSNQFKKLKEILIKAKNNLGKNFVVDFFEGIYDFENKKYELVINNFEKLNIPKHEVNVNINRNELLAKSYDNVGNYDKAYKYFVEVNNIVHKIFKEKYKKDKYIDTINKRINFFSEFELNKWSLELSEKKDPIFLLGFPRSGTTLLDTILRSHSAIEVIEEKPIIEKFIDKLKNEIGDDFSKLEKLDKNFFIKMRKTYFEERNKYVKFDKNKVYIDKLPLNLVFIGEIYRFFPNAKFIIALRNPYDVTLSCFMQQFTPNDAMMNFINLHDASHLYDLVMTLYLKYKRLFNSNIYEIKYEDIVANFDKSINNLLNFLDLEWEEKVKKFYETANKRGIISTPSFNQVNQKIYNKSVNRWINYDKKFLEIEHSLNKWIKEFNY